MFEAGIQAGSREYRFRIPEALPIKYGEKVPPREPILRKIELAGYAMKHVDQRQLVRIGAATTLPDQHLQPPADQRRQKSEGTFNHDRAIVSIREVASVPVRCIEVDARDGLYLITRRSITTHNSSIGRLGLVVHATAGFVDPGFQGTLTLEIANFNSVPIVLRPGLFICQLSFMALDRPAERPYGHPELGSHYHGQREATESRYRE
jgi:hypothetical protein